MVIEAIIAGTGVYVLRFILMSEPSPILLENSVRIAWDYLEATGELGNAEVAARFLTDHVESMMRRGEMRRLLLSNSAIDAYKRKLTTERDRLALVS